MKIFFVFFFLFFFNTSLYAYTNTVANNCIIVANAENFNFKSLEKNSISKYIILDGVANQTLRDKFLPDILLGDVDSIDKKTLKFFQNFPQQK